MKRISTDIAGRFTTVSASTYHDGVVLVGFLGDICPRNLTDAQISYIKTFYNMPNATHKFFDDWPEGIAPNCIAKNFKNGFMLIRKVIA